jgi:hypothetical protein
MPIGPQHLKFWGRAQISDQTPRRDSDNGSVTLSNIPAATQWVQFGFYEDQHTPERPHDTLSPNELDFQISTFYSDNAGHGHPSSWIERGGQCPNTGDLAWLSGFRAQLIGTLKDKYVVDYSVHMRKVSQDGQGHWTENDEYGTSSNSQGEWAGQQRIDFFDGGRRYLLWFCELNVTVKQLL